jgi:hypothetical protein
MRLQLVIEAVNHFQGTFSQLQKDVAVIKASTDGVADAGEKAGNSLKTAGKNAAGGFNEARQSISGVYQMLLLIVGSSLLKKLTDAGIGYNKSLEITKLGVAAIMTSMGVITDAQGRTLQGQEKWNAAQALSVEAQHELQKIGILTAATYEELVTTYQGLEAPMLSAKINFRDSLELTGLLTNSVKAMGLPLNQIVQEGRDLVSGTIDNNSQLARSLQITNEDVKKWREKGTVFEEIKKRLEGFTYASHEFENTWDGAWSNFKDFAQKALGEGSRPMFDFLKQEMKRISLQLVDIRRDAQGNIIDVQVKPEVVAKIKDISEEIIKLIRVLETFAGWGMKLAEPLMWVAIATGIYRMITAVRALAAEITLASGGINLILAAAATLGMWAGRNAADIANLEDQAKRIQNMTRGQTDHESARLKNMGVDNTANIEHFDVAQLSFVKKTLPSASDPQIAAMIRQGIISIKKEYDSYWHETFYKVNIDDAAAKNFLEAKVPGLDIKGTGKNSADEIKRQNGEARAVIEDGYKGQIEAIRRGEEEKAEALKTGLKEKELLFQQGAISEEEFLKAQAETQKAILEASIESTAAARKKLDEEWSAKKATYGDAAERSKAHKEYVSQSFRLEEELLKKTGELKRAGFDEEIKNIERLRAAESARKEGALKLLQEQLNGERDLTRLLLERGRITPLEAEKRNISVEQSGLEAEYWNVFAQKMTPGRTSVQLIEFEAQLRVLEERMDGLATAAPERLYRAGRDTADLDARREEARITHELAYLDEQEKTRQVGKLEALRQRKELLDQLLVSQTELQQSIDPTDATAWNSQQAAIDATRQRLLDLKLEMRDLSDDMAGGFAEGVAQYIDSVGGYFGQMRQLAMETAQAMEGSFSDFFFDAFRGKLKSFGDYVSSFFSSISRAIANVMAQRAAASVMGFDYGSLFSFRAEGGDVQAGKPYIVGEKGIELFIPQASGYIVSNRDLNRTSPASAGGSGAINFTQQINIAGDGGVSGRESGGGGKAAELGRMIKAAVTQVIIEQKRPGGLLG